MPYAPFIEQFGEFGWKETRNFTVFENNPYGLPPDQYGLIEAYCDDKGCDCRRVFFNVAARKRDDIVAVVSYGWEDEAFYRKWFGGGDDEYTNRAVNDMTGLALNLASPQSELAPAIMALVKDVLQDPNYAARIKRHYRMFKEKVDPKHFRPSGAAKQPLSAKPPSKKRHRPRSAGD
jgi:hypothetical protein